MTLLSCSIRCFRSQNNFHRSPPALDAKKLKDRANPRAKQLFGTLAYSYHNPTLGDSLYIYIYVCVCVCMYMYTYILYNIKPNTSWCLPKKTATSWFLPNYCLAFIATCPASRWLACRLWAMPLSGKDSLNFLFMGGSTALIAHGALARPADGPEGYMRLHPFLMGLAFSLMISLGFWMFLDISWYLSSSLFGGLDLGRGLWNLWFCKSYTWWDQFSYIYIYITISRIDTRTYLCQRGFWVRYVDGWRWGILGNRLLVLVLI